MCIRDSTKGELTNEAAQDFMNYIMSEEGPVSYTHLDVYKRQRQRQQACPVSNRKTEQPLSWS